MGGYGSGGWNHKGRPTVEDCFPITVNVLRQFNLFKVGRWAVLRWGGSSIRVELEEECYLLVSWKRKGEEEEQVQTVGYQWLAHKRHFGGYQTYLVCPRCCKPCTTVYLMRRFACRKCHALPYESQREQVGWRLRRKVEKLAKRLGFDYQWPETEVWFRPKWMRLKTFQKLAGAFQTTARQMYEVDMIELGRIGRC